MGCKSSCCCPDSKQSETNRDNPYIEINYNAQPNTIKNTSSKPPGTKTIGLRPKTFH